MTNEEIRQLAVWLKENHLDGAEVRRPGLHLLLKRGGETAPAALAAPAASAAPVVAGEELKTPGLGCLLLKYPGQAEALAALGSQVRSGQLVALLQVGDLLLPVRSQQAGQVAAVLVPCGTTVGYGQAFMRLNAA
ncbi:MULTISPECIES: biotin/lipoyl-containing protein [Pseudomonas]|uniref:biotin/lipoyl-containing protein n=1 Tax=Pseudomonas TaxID=286 RepID=UPI0005A8FDD0|nr:MULTISPECIES: biotin/lipoyl-containing protein [Pseudomonas]AZD36968.1 Biotin carboxyl carrier protein of acetyl-CoA carboxylase [Pseudomonas chlororaphis subsp. aurantiaca]AZD43307.1 Biotin carboxyl carrier protein of acetyl-CoA carboxylase [Pseudomonas chlororaphis subsp. aurantiaca]AZD49550.1 Biotin carboxyl carrier protein of acetyl-CoA carboxylase [Pseudomonas chlororaphis subsp. aurantiaca]AZD80674.1 Biotin carboxyl carrier protein of acetyl-CoA carboxylase [Pseudomonas chlororaphis su